MITHIRMKNFRSWKDKCEDGVSKIKSLELDDLGNIKNWPKNFFGNVRDDLAKITREQIKRQKEAAS